MFTYCFRQIHYFKTTFSKCSKLTIYNTCSAVDVVLASFVASQMDC